MAIQSMVIDPAGAPDMTGDEIVAAIDAGGNAITRESALNQDGLKLVKTQPTVGEFQIKNIHRDVAGKLEVEYDDVAEV